MLQLQLLICAVELQVQFIAIIELMLQFICRVPEKSLILLIYQKEEIYERKEVEDCVI